MSARKHIDTRVEPLWTNGPKAWRDPYGWRNYGHYLTDEEYADMVRRSPSWKRYDEKFIRHHILNHPPVVPLAEPRLKTLEERRWDFAKATGGAENVVRWPRDIPLSRFAEVFYCNAEAKKRDHQRRAVDKLVREYFGWEPAEPGVRLKVVGEIREDRSDG